MGEYMIDFKVQKDYFSSEGKISNDGLKVNDYNIISFNTKIKEIKMLKNNVYFINGKELDGIIGGIKQGLSLLIDKKKSEENIEDIKKCFELGCSILYDRKILDEVIEKQKQYDSDYVVDFFRYVLRIFLKRYESSIILTKNQCIDIKSLCKILLLYGSKNESDLKTLRRVSAKEIVESIKCVDI